jgi:hypothetical protein
LTYSHHPARLGGDLVLGKQWVDDSLCHPSVRIDVFVVQFEVRPLSGLVMLQRTRLCAFNAVCVHVILAPLDILKFPVDVGLDSSDVANVKLIPDKPF